MNMGMLENIQHRERFEVEPERGIKLYGRFRKADNAYYIQVNRLIGGRWFSGYAAVWVDKYQVWIGTDRNYSIHLYCKPIKLLTYKQFCVVYSADDLEKAARQVLLNGEIE